MKLIIGVDGSQTAEEAVRFAARLVNGLAAGEASEVILYHASELPYTPGTNDYFVNADTYLQLRDQAEARANRILADAEELLRQELASEAVAVRREAEFTAPAHGMANLAEDEAADLIVVGTRGLTGLRRLALGSVSRQVAELAPCSVLVVRHQEGQSKDETGSESPEEADRS